MTMISGDLKRVFVSSLFSSKDRAASPRKGKNLGWGRHGAVDRWYGEPVGREVTKHWKVEEKKTSDGIEAQNTRSIQKSGHRLASDFEAHDNKTFIL